MSLVDKAITFAAKAHINQFRKGTDIPYIVHPFCVGLILQKEGCSEDLICAGILHDTVEDTDVTLMDIRMEFNENIARIVEGCSEPDKKAGWEARKTHTINHVKVADKETGYCICADKIHNLQSIIEERQAVGDAIWSRFNRGRDQQEWYYKGVVKSFKENPFMASEEILDKLIKTVDDLFSS